MYLMPVPSPGGQGCVWPQLRMSEGKDGVCLRKDRSMETRAWSLNPAAHSNRSRSSRQEHPSNSRNQQAQDNRQRRSQSLCFTSLNILPDNDTYFLHHLREKCSRREAKDTEQDRRPCCTCPRLSSSAKAIHQFVA